MSEFEEFTVGALGEFFGVIGSVALSLEGRPGPVDAIWNELGRTEVLELNGRRVSFSVIVEVARSNFAGEQTVTGERTYSEIIGNGTLTTFPIWHQLGASVLSSLTVRETAANGRFLTQNADFNASVPTGNNRLDLTFAAPPATNSLLVSVSAFGSVVFPGTLPKVGDLVTHLATGAVYRIAGEVQSDTLTVRFGLDSRHK